MHIRLAAELYQASLADLVGRKEGAGFFLAEFSPASQVFVLEEWRPIPAEEFESRSRFHLVLRDDVKADIIKWAWDSKDSLVEVHSHDFYEGARFSPSDLYGLRAWVPHLWWRLRGRPYAAVVFEPESFDALAWVQSADLPEQVETLQIANGDTLLATGRTLRTMSWDKHGRQ